MNIRILGVAAIATLAMAGCTSTPDYGYGGAPPVSSSTASCYDCGTVTRIETVGGTRSGLTGAVLGGVVGAAAGRELADDESKGRQNTATAVGAVAGAAAGSAIQRNMSGGSYNVHVRMSDGRVVVVNQNDLGGIREGSYVRVYNGRAWIR